MMDCESQVMRGDLIHRLCRIDPCRRGVEARRAFQRAASRGRPGTLEGIEAATHAAAPCDERRHQDDEDEPRQSAAKDWVRPFPLNR